MKYVVFDNKKIYPSKIICVGRNYVGHIKELGNSIPEQAVIFNKPNSAISDEIYSVKKNLIHYEGEICFLIENKNISGVGFGLDLTKRDVQSKLKTQGFPWERSKAFDKSAVFSDFISFNGNIDKLRMELYINNQLIQSGSCKLMLNKPFDILNEVSTFQTIEDGDIIMTGTPKGVGVINKDDLFLARLLEGDDLLIEKFWIAK